MDAHERSEAGASPVAEWQAALQEVRTLRTMHLQGSSSSMLQIRASTKDIGYKA
jgi:hypothetical protein